jgi:hypothetical protein
MCQSARSRDGGWVKNSRKLLGGMWCSHALPVRLVRPVTDMRKERQGRRFLSIPLVCRLGLCATVGTALLAVDQHRDQWRTTRSSRAHEQCSDRVSVVRSRTGPKTGLWSGPQSVQSAVLDYLRTGPMVWSSVLKSEDR